MPVLIFCQFAQKIVQAAVTSRVIRPPHAGATVRLGPDLPVECTL